MFGTNPIRKAEHGDGTTLAVQEIFTTIQGEGPLAGTPAVFIRLAGCNLACKFCDTEFESGIDNRKSVEDIVSQVLEDLESYPGVRTVVLTGGEPFRQNIVPLIDSLFSAHGIDHLQIETAGTLWLEELGWPWYFPYVSIVCSPKTPKVHRKIIEYCTDWKYIIKAGETSIIDGLPTTATQTEGVEQQIFRADRDDSDCTIWVQPCDEHDDTRNKANRDECVAVAMRHGYRLSLQQHKILGLP